MLSQRGRHAGRSGNGGWDVHDAVPWRSWRSRSASGASDWKLVPLGRDRGRGPHCIRLHRGRKTHSGRGTLRVADTAAGRQRPGHPHHLAHADLRRRTATAGNPARAPDRGRHQTRLPQLFRMPSRNRGGIAWRSAMSAIRGWALPGRVARFEECAGRSGISVDSMYHGSSSQLSL